jgi:hypothetical protein
MLAGIYEESRERLAFEVDQRLRSDEALWVPAGRIVWHGAPYPIRRWLWIPQPCQNRNPRQQSVRRCAGSTSDEQLCRAMLLEEPGLSHLTTEQLRAI